MPLTLMAPMGEWVHLLRIGEDGIAYFVHVTSQCT